MFSFCNDITLYLEEMDLDFYEDIALSLRKWCTFFQGYDFEEIIIGFCDDITLRSQSLVAQRVSINCQNSTHIRSITQKSRTALKISCLIKSQSFKIEIMAHDNILIIAERLCLIMRSGDEMFVVC